jgi:AAA domain
MAIEFAQIIGPLAESLLGEPNRAMSTPSELRYGSRGSLSVDLAKGTWFDHEANEGGGALDLVTRETHLTGQDRLDWLKTHGFLYETIPNISSGQVAPRPFIVATYDYTNETGELLFQVCRFEPKDFRQRRPDGLGGWIWSIKGVPFVPYRLHQLLQNEDRVVVVVEGEKDCDRLWKLGIPATTNPGGAGKWREELSEFFRGGDVVIIPDYDPQKRHPKTKEPMFHPDGRPILPGQDHAQLVAASLQGIATRVRVLELWKHWPDMPLKGDISDWITNGGTAEQLYTLIDKTPLWSRTDIVSVPLLYPFPIDGKAIPRRKWLVPGLLLRRNVTILVAPPGSGKSLLTLQIAIMLARGTEWGGWRPRGTHRSLVINAEDDSDEMCRRLFAACEAMEIRERDKELLRSRVAIAETPGDIIIAKADYRSKTVIATPMVDSLVQTVTENSFDVLVVDPFAETFQGDENSNSELKWAAVLWRKIARETNSAVLLVHHTRKFGAEAGSMDSARGGGALVGVARIVSTLFGMTPQEAEAFGVSEEERHQYLRFDDAKANLSLVTFAARWFRKETYTLPNAGDDEPADEVGALQPWEPEGIFQRMSNELANKILDVIAAGIIDKSGRPTGDMYSSAKKGDTKRWAGKVVLDHIDCTPKEAQTVITAWVKSGLLVEFESITSTSHGKMRKGLSVIDVKRPGTLISEERIG